MRRFPRRIVRFSYAQPSGFAVANLDGFWPDISDSKKILTMAEKLLDKMRRIIRVRHYSLRTEKAYLHWA
jgi:hypothetical protein